jgi:hypothetical protein
VSVFRPPPPQLTDFHETKLGKDVKLKIFYLLFLLILIFRSCERGRPECNRVMGKHETSSCACVNSTIFKMVGQSFHFQIGVIVSVCLLNSSLSSK